MVFTRPATLHDADQMVDLINEIVAIGGTTAHQTPFDRDRMIHHYLQPPLLVSCTIAETEGVVVGFQTNQRVGEVNAVREGLPADWGIIATFARHTMTGQGIGGALFAATKTAARASGLATIDATIRADNAGGLAYYSKMGFVDYGVLRAVPLRDGTPVDRIRKRFDLD